MINVILQFTGLDLFNIKLSENIPNGLRVNLHFFSEFEPRQKLNQSQMSFNHLMRYILSILMNMQNFITIFHSVQEIAPLSLFQNLELGGKALTNENIISQFLGLDLVNINVYATVYQNIPLSLRERAIFTFSDFGARQSID